MINGCSKLALFSLTLALGGAAAGCDPAIGEIGLHPLPSPDHRAAPAAEPAEEVVLQSLFQDFGLSMHKLNVAPVPSVAVPGSSLDLYVSEDGIDHYMQARMDATGSRTALPMGTVIMRVVRDGAGKVTKYTALAQREPGFNPPSDLWFAVASCTSCHLTRSDDGYIFGMPQ